MCKLNKCMLRFTCKYVKNSFNIKISQLILSPIGMEIVKLIIILLLTSHQSCTVLSFFFSFFLFFFIEIIVHSVCFSLNFTTVAANFESVRLE